MKIYDYGTWYKFITNDNWVSEHESQKINIFKVKRDTVKDTIYSTKTIDYGGVCKSKFFNGIEVCRQSLAGGEQHPLYEKKIYLTELLRVSFSRSGLDGERTRSISIVDMGSRKVLFYKTASPDKPAVYQIGGIECSRKQFLRAKRKFLKMCRVSK